jgi:hypothetical protein
MYDFAYYYSYPDPMSDTVFVLAMAIAYGLWYPIRLFFKSEAVQALLDKPPEKSQKPEGRPRLKRWRIPTAEDEEGIQEGGAAGHANKDGSTTEQDGAMPATSGADGDADPT